VLAGGSRAHHRSSKKRWKKEIDETSTVFTGHKRPQSLQEKNLLMDREIRRVCTGRAGKEEMVETKGQKNFQKVRIKKQFKIWK